MQTQSSKRRRRPPAKLRDSSYVINQKRHEGRLEHTEGNDNEVVVNGDPIVVDEIRDEVMQGSGVFGNQDSINVNVDDNKGSGVFGKQDNSSANVATANVSASNPNDSVSNNEVHLIVDNDDLPNGNPVIPEINNNVNKENNNEGPSIISYADTVANKENNKDASANKKIDGGKGVEENLKKDSPSQSFANVVQNTQKKQVVTSPGVRFKKSEGQIDVTAAEYSNLDVGVSVIDEGTHAAPHNPPGQPIKSILRNSRAPLVTSSLELNSGQNVASYVHTADHNVCKTTQEAGHMGAAIVDQPMSLDENDLVADLSPNACVTTPIEQQVKSGTNSDGNNHGVQQSSIGNSSSRTDMGSPKVTNDAGNSNVVNHMSNSFASLLQTDRISKPMCISEMRSNEQVEGAAVTLPYAAVEEVMSRLSNTLVGYFIGKRLAFPMVEAFVKNAWMRYGLKRVKLHGEFFLFQFETKSGMDEVLETGPWMIRQVPLILNIWSSTTTLKKEETKKVPVWVKLYQVPIVAYSEIGLSLISTQIGRPIMMDSYTSDMCKGSWGRSDYARVLIEVSADEALKKSLVVAVPIEKDKEHSLVTIDVEYQWTPPRCSSCLIFDHIDANCPRMPSQVMADPEGVRGTKVQAKVFDANIEGNEDGFKVVTNKRRKRKKNLQVAGVNVPKPALNLQYRPVEKGDNSITSKAPKKKQLESSTFKRGFLNNNASTSNSFNVLRDNMDDDVNEGSNVNDDVLNADSEVDEEIVIDDRNGIRQPDTRSK